MLRLWNLIGPVEGPSASLPTLCRFVSPSYIRASARLVTEVEAKHLTRRG